ncbi:hypothetical protein [Massilia antarctica]|uniref:hypothetical protein n=1 Tax=Massilia antarctica TaxID=2765360 RepID=UPI0006BB9808|nr:hypothetical protein [Massilia sp. H27-R4]MCY0911483.1 hypothetical protein [Massilia sp. H27-R4]CUI04910.1 hypothetical protein BN2497_4597 [Janthinobacterium sp. CG23_2]CUU28696.1 hypothetical protein BN3177_4597 [Janthinobacterium sp. CG23_2]
MKPLHVLTLAALLACAPLTHAAAAAAAAPAVVPAASTTVAAPDAARVKAVQAMLAAMQTEKMMRSVAGASRYANEEQRASVFAKLDKVAPQEIYQRLAMPVARVIGVETANELAAFYGSDYGKRVLQQTYNSRASMFPPEPPVPNAAEKKMLKRPELVQARKELAAADATIRHEAFMLLQAIIKK